MRAPDAAANVVAVVERVAHPLLLGKSVLVLH
jgi:hypothetical protein